MEDRLFLQCFAMFPRHSFGRKDDDRGNIGWKNLQPIIDPAFVRDDHTQRAAKLTALGSSFLQFSRKSEPDVVASQAGVTDQNRIGQSALAKQMQLVFT